MSISERIFALLSKKGMTQKEFSERTEISQSTISDWKRKKTNPSADKILIICEVLQITPYELLAENIGDMNRDEKIVLESFRSLQNRQKERLMGYLAALQEK